MGLKLFNTLSREKEEFKPINEGEVMFYSCGQTIYDDLHIGNARPYAVWDTLTRFLRWNGFSVRHVQNITDVGHLTDDGDQGEDKVEKRARELGLEPMELVEDQIERYFDDTKALNIRRQHIVPRATGHINEVVYYVKKIIENGYGYEVDGNVYLDLEAYSKDYPYGEMAKKDLQQLKEEAEARVEHDPKKKNQYDFAIWINADEEHLMKWQSPWGKGYPGWHMECSVMGQKYLGEEFDIHAGGKDHIFPHHPNERAQCFAATGKGQARYWIHNEFVKWEGEKMSKSKGNFITVRDLLEEGYPGEVLRLYLISFHYRSEANFTRKGLDKARKELSKARKVVQKIRKNPGEEIMDLEALENNFEEYMNDDLNTAKAKQELMEFVSRAHSKLETGVNLDTEIAENLEELFSILGINLEPEISEEESEMADILVEQREEARKEADYETADDIRERLSKLGFTIEDTEEGPKWYKE